MIERGDFFYNQSSSSKDRFLVRVPARGVRAKSLGASSWLCSMHGIPVPDMEVAACLCRRNWDVWMSRSGVFLELSNKQTRSEEYILILQQSQIRSCKGVYLLQCQMAVAWSLRYHNSHWWGSRRWRCRLKCAHSHWLCKVCWNNCVQNQSEILKVPIWSSHQLAESKQSYWLQSHYKNQYPVNVIVWAGGCVHRTETTCIVHVRWAVQELNTSKDNVEHF